MDGNTNTIYPKAYQETFEAVLRVCSKSLLTLIEYESATPPLEPLNSALAKIALELWEEPFANNIPQLNRHLLEGFPNRKYQRKPENLFPRISKIVYLHYFRSKGTSSDAVFLPSPVALACDCLTVPEFPETREYSYAAGTRYLLKSSGLLLNYAGEKKFWPEDQLCVDELVEIILSMRNYIKGRDPFPGGNTKSAFVGHFLSMRGYFRLRFGTVGKQKNERQETDQEVRRWLNDISTNSKFAIDSSAEFRLATHLNDLPETQELTNQLLGISLPIFGASNIFFGGIRRSQEGATVASLCGSPGTGKTTFALALAAALAPLGVKTLFVSLEESENNIRARLRSLIPNHLRQTSISIDETKGWFTTIGKKEGVEDDPVEQVSRHVAEIKRILSAIPSSAAEQERRSMTDQTRHLVVIDGVTAFESALEQGNRMEQLVAALHEIRAIVIFTSTELFSKRSSLEHLVDIAARLQYRGTDSLELKPLRVFQLDKSRLQLSRPGSHVMHLSGDEGIRLSPQVLSVLDDRRIWKRPLPDHSRIFDCFALENDSSKRLVDVRNSSRVLLYGRSSAGKAGLALRLLCSNFINDETGRNDDFYRRSKKVLVISFLYPRSYYTQIVGRRIRRLHSSQSSDFVDPLIDILDFAPGSLSAEEFLSTVFRKLESALLEGFPFNRILVDGLHNVALQFPRLAQNDMVWPALGSLLNRYQCTVVNTFTTFESPGSIDFGRENHTPHDTGEREFILRAHRPFLHSLIQSTDYFIQVEGVHSYLNENARPDEALIRINSSISPGYRRDCLVLDRQSIRFIEFRSPNSGNQQELF